MKKIRYAVLFGVIASAVLAQTGSRIDDEKGVLESERRWAEAGRVYDAQAMGALLTEDYVGTSATGRVRDKAETIRDIEATSAAVKQTNSSLPAMAPMDVRVRFLGQVAVVTGGGTTPGANGFPIRFTRVWIKSGQDWHLATQHISRVPPVPKP